MFLDDFFMLVWMLLRGLRLRLLCVYASRDGERGAISLDSSQRRRSVQIRSYTISTYRGCVFSIVISGIPRATCRAESRSSSRWCATCPSMHGSGLDRRVPGSRCGTRRLSGTGRLTAWPRPGFDVDGDGRYGIIAVVSDLKAHNSAEIVDCHKDELWSS